MLATGKKTVRAFLQDLLEKEQGYTDRRYIVSLAHTLYTPAALLAKWERTDPAALERTVYAEWGDYGSTVCYVRHNPADSDTWLHIRIVWL